MRFKFLIIVFVLLASPALALEATDTMQAWNESTSADKKELLNRLAKSGSEKSSKSDVSSCVNDAAKMEAHSNLIIAEVYKACSEQSAKDNI